MLCPPLSSSSFLLPLLLRFPPAKAATSPINASLARDCTAMRDLLADATVFDRPERLHALVLDNVTHGCALLDVVASLALLYRPRLLLFLFTGHGSAPSPGIPAALRFQHGVVGAVQLAPLLRACRAQTTLVLLDCCHSTGVFHNVGFPGLAVVPACGDNQTVTAGFTCQVLVPILRGICAQQCVKSESGCAECQKFIEACANRRVVLWPLIEHLRHHLPVCFGVRKRADAQEEQERRTKEERKKESMNQNQLFNFGFPLLFA